jgi:PiT family inorganic phosphate transporter
MTLREEDVPAPRVAGVRKTSLDKDLRKIERLEEAVRSVSRNPALGIALLFLAIAGVLASSQIGAQPNALLMIVAAVIGGYMALTIGANDVANNVGPAVGARALTMSGALILAAIFECAGALIAGGSVVETVSKDIIDPALVPSGEVFVWVMMSALLASALWVHLATFLGAPVSTTHAIIGGVLGAGIAAVGVGVVDWLVVSSILFSWLVSPLIGGLVAALFLAFIKINVIYRDDKIAAARRWVPALVALMTATFSGYLIVKGLNHVWRPGLPVIAAMTCAAFAAAYVAAKPWVRRQSENMENRNQSLRKLFNLPLICSAALLSFAHGSNDVANAVGPLAAILHSAESGSLAREVGVPFWVMLIGAAGISLGLFLFGPRTHRRRADHQDEPDAGFLRRPVGWNDGAGCLPAGLARQHHPHRGWRRLRRRLLPRVLYDAQPSSPELCKHAQTALNAAYRAGGLRGAATPQAGTPVAFHGHCRRVGDHCPVGCGIGSPDILRRAMGALS